MPGGKSVPLPPKKRAPILPAVPSKRALNPMNNTEDMLACTEEMELVMDMDTTQHNPRVKRMASSAHHCNPVGSSPAYLNSFQLPSAFSQEEEEEDDGQDWYLHYDDNYNKYSWSYYKHEYGFPRIGVKDRRARARLKMSGNKWYFFQEVGSLEQPPPKSNDMDALEVARVYSAAGEGYVESSIRDATLACRMPCSRKKARWIGCERRWRNERVLRFCQMRLVL